MNQVLQPKVLDSLGLVPNISNIFLIKNSSSYYNINFEINVPVKQKKNPWIFEQNILSMLDLGILFCFNKELQLELLQDNAKIYSKINLEKYTEGKDYIQKFSKIQPSKLNFAKKSSTLSEVLSTGFSENITIETLDVKHFSVFISILLSNEEISKKFNIGLDKLKSIIGTFLNETFIEDGKYINSKLNDITVFKDKQRFNFNSTAIINPLSNSSVKLLNRTESNYFSELYYSWNKEKNLTGYFYVDIQKILKEKSSLPVFFENNKFLQNFYSNKQNYYPFCIKIKRYNNVLEETLYEGIFDDFISNNLIKINKLSFENDKMFISFCDLESNTLNKKYKYKIELFFSDNTLKYFSNLKERVLVLDKNIQTIYNIAKTGNYYLLALNSFNPQFFKTLLANKLSLENTIIEIANILTEFKFLDNNTITSIKTLAYSKFHNFDTLDSFMDILGFLKSEISRLENFSKNKLFSDIKVETNFSNKDVDFEKEKDFLISLFPSDISRGYSFTSNTQFYDRVLNETSKFYSVSELNNSNKYRFLSPYKIDGKYNSIIQNSNFNELDFDLYNELFIDYFMSKITKENFSSMSRTEKLQNVLNHYGINVSLFTKEAVYVENTNKKTNSLNLTKNNVQIDQKILFDLFINCLVLKDGTLFNFEFLNPNSEKSKVAKIDPSSLPIQTDSVIKSYRNDKVSINSAQSFDQIISSKNNFFAVYMNYKNIYILQYLDITDFQWKNMEENIVLGRFDKILCRFIPYLNYDLQINKNNLFDLTEIDDIFVLEWQSQIQSRQPSGDVVQSTRVAQVVQQDTDMQQNNSRTPSASIQQSNRAVIPSRAVSAVRGTNSQNISKLSVTEKQNIINNKKEEVNIIKPQDITKEKSIRVVNQVPVMEEKVIVKNEVIKNEEKVISKIDAIIEIQKNEKQQDKINNISTERENIKKSVQNEVIKKDEVVSKIESIVESVVAKAQKQEIVEQIKSVVQSVISNSQSVPEPVISKQSVSESIAASAQTVARQQIEQKNQEVIKNNSKPQGINDKSNYPKDVTQQAKDLSPEELSKALKTGKLKK
jgi:hypothetical protein